MNHLNAQQSSNQIQHTALLMGMCMRGSGSEACVDRRL